MVKNEIGHRYWNFGNIAVVVVAVRGVIGDWAAYIGGSEFTWTEEQTVEEAAGHGCKLSEKIARAFFPHVEGYYRP